MEVALGNRDSFSDIGKGEDKRMTEEILKEPKKIYFQSSLFSVISFNLQLVKFPASPPWKSWRAIV